MKRYLPDFIFLACLFLVFAIYFPGTSGYFQFDDTINILENTRIQIHFLNIQSLAAAAFSGHAGFLQRPISVMSFALNYYFTGFDPFHFKLTNIAIHLLNGIAIHYLSRLLLGAYRSNSATPLAKDNDKWIALAIAVAWLLHPLNLTGVLYIVQRMTSLSAFFTICGMISYAIGRSRQKKGLLAWPQILISFVVFTPLAMLSKENGALLPPILLLTELAFFRFQAPTLQMRRKLIALFSVTVLLPLIAIIVYMMIHPEWLASTYQIRDFTLIERCLTETRVIWFYIRLIFIPDITEFGLHHDDFAISHSLFDPLSTIFAVVGLCFLVLSALFTLKHHPIVAFGALFFLLGHSLESSVFPLELIHEHRNYLADFGLLFILFYYCLAPLKKTPSLKVRSSIAIFFILILGIMTFMRAVQWGDPVQLKLKEVERHPNSVRANIEIAHFYAGIPPTSQENAQELYSKAYKHFAVASEISPSDTLGLFGLIALHASKSMTVETAWIDALSNRLKNYPVAAHTSNSLASLSVCVINKTCVGIEYMTERLFRSLLKNPTLAGNSRIHALFAWSDFLYRINHDNDAAFGVAKEAVLIDILDLDNQLNFAVILINLGKKSEAKTQIDLIHSLDKLNAYSDKLKELEKILHQP